MGPLTMEILLTELRRDHLANARQAELAAQLPPTPSRVGSAAAATRQHLAGGLRALAARLDPSLSHPNHSHLARA